MNFGAHAEYVSVPEDAALALKPGNMTYEEAAAICSSSNIELLKSLGDDEVIDYTEEDFTRNGEKYDVIFDTVGKSSIGKAFRSLNKDGQLLQASAGIGTIIGGSIKSIFINKKNVSGVKKEMWSSPLIRISEQSYQIYNIRQSFNTSLDISPNPTTTNPLKSLVSEGFLIYKFMIKYGNLNDIMPIMAGYLNSITYFWIG